MIDRDVVIGGIYEHFKGKKYQVLCEARDSTYPHKEYIVYRALYDSYITWIRPKDEFMGRLPNGEYRFNLM